MSNFVGSHCRFLTSLDCIHGLIKEAVIVFGFYWPIKIEACSVIIIRPRPLEAKVELMLIKIILLIVGNIIRGSTYRPTNILKYWEKSKNSK